jgi:hypothetical protein
VSSFKEYPEHIAAIPRPFIVEIIERLLHGLAQPLAESLRIEAQEFLVESMNHALIMGHDLSGLAGFQASGFLPAAPSTTGFPAR